MQTVVGKEPIQEVLILDTKDQIGEKDKCLKKIKKHLQTINNKQ